MPDIANYNGIDMGTISKISGQDAPSGGIPTPSEGTTGVLLWERSGDARSSKLPNTNEFLPASVPHVYKHALHSLTDIIRLRFGQYHYFALDSSGVLYSAGWTNQNYMGRSITGVGNEPHKLVQCLTNVSKFDVHDNGAWAIKTDGTLWWCGNISNFAASGDTGQSTTIANNQFLQFGTDTDWIDLASWPTFPYKTIAIKGGTGAEYLYGCGSNSQGGLPVGTSSGSTKPWTRAKSAASTDLTETFSAGGLDLGYQNGMAVSSSGKLYAWGEGNTGVLGSGNTTDNFYATQVGTDTDWSKPFVYSGRNAGLCIKTDGTLYMSTNSLFSLGLQPATANRTYQQVTTDTDFQDFRYPMRTTSAVQDLVFIKKGGSWYANWDSTITYPHSFGGSSNLLTPATNSFTALNDFLQGNGVTATITELTFMFIEANVQKGYNLWVCTSTS